MADQDSQIPSVGFTMGFKQGNPQATDEQIIQAFRATKAQLGDQLNSMDPNQQAQLGKTLGTGAPVPEDVRPTAAPTAASNIAPTMAQPTSLGRVDITGKKQATYEPTDVSTNITAAPTVGTKLASPWAGTQMAARNAENPAAAIMDLSDPENVRRAYADAAQKYNELMPARLIANYLGASSSPAALESSKKTFQGLADMPLELLKAQQTAGAQGILNANPKGIQDISKTAGEYELSQAKGQQALTSSVFDNVTKGLNTQQVQRMSQPDSTETLLAKQLILAQLSSVPLTDREALNKILQDPTVTAQQLMPAMAQYVPAALKAYTDRISATKTQVETSGMAQSQDIANRDTGIPARTVWSGTRLSPATLSVLTKNARAGDKESIAALAGYNEKFPTQAGAATADLTKPEVGTTDYTKEDVQDFGSPKTYQQRNPKTVTTGPTGSSMSPAPYAQQSQQQAKSQVDNTGNFIAGFNATGKLATQSVLRNSENAGRGHLLNYANVTNNPDVAQLKADIDQMNSQLTQAGLQPSKQEAGAAGAVLGTVGAGMANAGGKIPGTVGGLMTTGGVALSGGAGMVNGGQPLTVTSPPQRLREASIKLQTLAEQQALLLPKLRTFAEKNNYNIDGWTETPVYKKIMKMVPVVDKSGRVILLDENEQMPKGYKTAHSAIATGV